MDLYRLTIVASCTAPALVTIARSLEADADAMDDVAGEKIRAIQDTTYGSLHVLDALASTLERAADGGGD